MKGRAQIRGFHPGKVPKAHLKKLYGKSAMAEIVNTVIGETSNKALEERSEKAAMQPQIKLSDEDAEKILDGGADLAYDISYEVVPSSSSPLSTASPSSVRSSKWPTRKSKSA